MQQYNGSVLALKLMEQGWKVEASTTNSLRWSKEIEGKIIESYSSSLTEPPELVIKVQEQLDRKLTGKKVHELYGISLKQSGIRPFEWDEAVSSIREAWGTLATYLNIEIEKQVSERVAEKVAALTAPTEVSSEKPTEGEVDKMELLLSSVLG